MKADLKKLSIYESAVISMIALGMLIIGFEIFVSLPNKAHVALSDAVAIFDIHEGVSEQAEQFQELFGMTKIVLEEFNKATIETLAIDQELNIAANEMNEVYGSAARYAVNFINEHRTQALAFEGSGEVLGASVVMTEDSCSHDEQVTVIEQKEIFKYDFDYDLPTFAQVEKFFPLLSIDY